MLSVPSRSLPARTRITVCPKWCSTGDLCKEMWHGRGVPNPAARHKGKFHRVERLLMTSPPPGTTHTACVLPRARKVTAQLECERRF